MVDAIISSLASSLAGFGERRADNFIDRLNRFHASILLLFLACLVSSKQLLGSPIECWCPAQFTENQVRYTNSYCWVSSTHYLPNDQPIIPRAFPKDYRITYYQWVPLAFLIQSFLCHLPHLLWRFLLQQNGANVSGLMEAAVMASKASQLEIREKAISIIVSNIDRYTSTRRHSDSSCYHRVMNVLSRKFFFFGGRSYGNFLANGYLFVKAVYISNSVLQIQLLDQLLGEDKNYLLYGMKAIHGMLMRMPWTAPDHFPVDTLCEVEIRDQSRIHNYVVQCVLSINIFNEKIFVLLWFCFFALILLTTIDLIVWFVHNFYWNGSVRFVSKRLRARSSDKPHSDPVLLSRFVRSYLRRDGMVILRLISSNCGDVIIGEILDQLWLCYLPRPSERTYANLKSGIKARDTSISMRESSSTVQLV